MIDVMLLAGVCLLAKMFVDAFTMEDER